MKRKKWYIGMMDFQFNIKDTMFEGTIEEAKAYAEKWAQKGDWEEPKVVLVQIWDKSPSKEGAKLIDKWYETSFRKKEEKKTWFIRLESEIGEKNTTKFGTLEEAKKYAEEWASEGDWSKPVVEVRVELWDGNPHESNANIIGGWYQYSYDTSKLDPFREAEHKYWMEHGYFEGRCPICGKVGPKVRTPGLGGMDKYLSWREAEPHAFLAWCECPTCGNIWNRVDENYVFNVALGMWVRYGYDYLLKIFR